VRNPARRGRFRLAMLPWYFRALAAAALVEVALRALPLDRAAALLGVPLDRAGGREDESVPAEVDGDPRARATRAVLRRWPFGDGCLREALVLGRMLRDEEPRLVIGVGNASGDIVAHAWLETPRGSIGHDPSMQALRSSPQHRSVT
jgi:hypothetical protein